MSAAENRKLFLAVLVILAFRSEIVRSAQVYLSSGQVGAFFRLALNIWDRVQGNPPQVHSTLTNFKESVQDVDIQCWNSLGRPYFPLLYKAGLSAGGSIQAVGPLYANQHILCQTGEQILSKHLAFTQYT